MRFLLRSLLSMRFLLGAAATIAGLRAWRGLSRRRATQAHPQLQLPQTGRRAEGTPDPQIGPARQMAAGLQAPDSFCGFCDG